MILLNFTHSVLSKMDLHEIRVDHQLTIAEVRHELAVKLGSSDDSISLHFHSGGAIHELNDESQTLIQAGVANLDTIHIKEKDPMMFLLQFEEAGEKSGHIDLKSDILGDHQVP